MKKAGSSLIVVGLGQMLTVGCPGSNGLIRPIEKTDGQKAAGGKVGLESPGRKPAAQPTPPPRGG